MFRGLRRSISRGIGTAAGFTPYGPQANALGSALMGRRQGNVSTMVDDSLPPLSAFDRNYQMDIGKNQAPSSVGGYSTMQGDEDPIMGAIKGRRLRVMSKGGI